MRQRKIRFYQNEEEILAAIDNARAEAKKALERSAAEDAVAKAFFQEGPNFRCIAEEHVDQSKKAARKYVLLMEKTIPALAQKLAEIRTPVMFDGMDSAIPRRIRKTPVK